jgi:predicted DNA-binding transcriptional regulator
MSDKAQIELSRLGITSSSFKILCHLTFRARPIKPKELAAELEMNPATVRARISELYSRDLLTLDSRGYSSNIRSYDILMKFYKSPRKGVDGSRIE